MVKKGAIADSSNFHSVLQDGVAVLRGAGLAVLGRFGSLIELVAIALFAKLFGHDVLGLFLLFMAVGQLITLVCTLGMISALQRFVPSVDSDDEVHRVLRGAIIVPMLAAITMAALVFLLAQPIASLVNSGFPDDTIARMIQIFAWAIPFTCFVELAASAVRARQVFGPEIRLRIVYEQLARLLIGLALFYAGLTVFGLVVAQLVSIVITAFLALRLLGRYYDFKLLFRFDGRRDMQVLRRTLKFSLSVMFPSISHSMHAEVPLVALNTLIPGTAGAAAVAYYAAARKLVSVLQVVHLSFEYVMAPFASGKNSRAEHHSLRTVYALTTRMIWTMFIPLAAALLLLRYDLLGVIGEDFAVAGTAIIILTIGRLIEAGTGPSNIIIEMIGRYHLPFINMVLGLVTTVALVFLLLPDMYINGAAIAAAAGIDVTALAALTEIYIFHGMHPYDRKLLRPVVTALVMSLAMTAILAIVLAGLGHIPRIVVGIAVLIFVLGLLLKLGFTKHDQLFLSPKRANQTDEPDSTTMPPAELQVAVRENA